MHQNARLTPSGRALLVNRVLEGDVTPGDAGRAAGVSRRCQRRLKMSHSWRPKMSHFGGGDEPQVFAVASLDSGSWWRACQSSECFRIR